MKEAKILSEFFHSKLVCLIQFAASGSNTPKVPPVAGSEKIQGVNNTTRTGKEQFLDCFGR